jgi:type IV pilus assembly protein PilB
MEAAATIAPPKQVGRILIERGLITEAQIEQALAEQKKTGHRKLLGEAIVEMGFCTEDQVIEALAEAYGMPYVKLNPKFFDPRVFSALPRDFIDKQCVLPLFKVDGVLTVAVHEPANVYLIEEISEIAQCTVQVVAATASDIHVSFDAHQIAAKRLDFDDLLEDVSDNIDTVEQPSLDIANLTNEADESPVIKLVNYIIYNAVRDGASDVHIEPDDNVLRVRYRVDGQLVEKLNPPVQMSAPLVSRIKIMASLDISERRLPQDGAIHVRIEGRPVDLRVSVLPNRHGEKIVLRIIDNRNAMVSLAQLGFDMQTLDQFQRQINQPHGLLLVTGPTGSGKSTTLYAALGELNSPSINICTVEDPIEFNIPGVNQFQVNEKIGFTFPGTLRSLLRQDPDVIMVGEIRDSETAKIAVQSALTGHLVFSTLHTNDAASAVTRLYNVGVEPYLISASLVGVLAQRLVRKLCSNCSEEVAPTASILRSAERVGQTIERMFVGTGCTKCRKTGYAGRIGLYEMLVPDDEMRDAITGGATLNALRIHAKRTGMRSLIEDGFEKIRQGITTAEEVLRVTATET